MDGIIFTDGGRCAQHGAGDVNFDDVFDAGDIQDIVNACEPNFCGIPLCGMGGFGMMPWMIGRLWVMRRRARRGRGS